MEPPPIARVSPPRPVRPEPCPGLSPQSGAGLAGGGISAPGAAPGEPPLPGRRRRRDPSSPPPPLPLHLLSRRGDSGRNFVGRLGKRRRPRLAGGLGLGPGAPGGAAPVPLPPQPAAFQPPGAPTGSGRRDGCPDAFRAGEHRTGRGSPAGAGAVVPSRRSRRETCGKLPAPAAAVPGCRHRHQLAHGVQACFQQLVSPVVLGKEPRSAGLPELAASEDGWCRVAVPGVGLAELSSRHSGRSRLNQRIKILPVPLRAKINSI